MKLMQLPLLFAAIRVFHIFKDALPFGISIGARPAIDERGILDFEEQKSVRPFEQALGCPLWIKKNGKQIVSVSHLPQNAPMMGAVREESS